MYRVLVHILMMSAFALSIQTAISAPRERKLYTATNSTEAKMEFQASVEYKTNRTPHEKTLRRVIESQLEHMIGPMSMMDYTASPKGDHIVSNIKIVSQKDSLVTVSYNYSGTAVIQNGPTDTYDLYLPINPATIYRAAMIGTHNPCTDEHYQAVGDFWYFWSPNRPGCRLKEGVDYRIVEAKITRFKNSKVSYPEYQNLPDEKGNITIHVLFGMDDPSLHRNPLVSTDINAVNFRIFRNYLIKNGYIPMPWSESQIRAIAKTTNGTVPYVENFKKGKIIYRFFYGATGIDEDSLAFHWFYKDAIENSSVMMYEGHSGLGGHLDLDSVEQSLGVSISFNHKRYQIFFFDSCSSYKYYNQMYFERKKSSQDPRGTKKLDIFTNGLATAFDTLPQSSMAVNMALEKSLNYALAGNGFVSYQTLAKQIDSGNLFGVNGDEDNVAPSPIK